MTRFGLLLLSLLGAATLICAQSSDTEGKSLTEIEQLMSVQVQTASLRKQTLQDAPANVTVVTAEDIHRHGYRTLAEVLASTRSFYTSSDGDLRFAGVRGFSLLGDYNTRFLVMINGHALTDNVYGAMYYFGQDFPLDMDIVHQIEIVRGPTSALYGSNGLFATINIITLTPTNAPRGQVSSEVGSFGQQKITASSSFAIGGDARLLISASGVHEGGRTVDFAELAQAGTSPSRTDHAESGRGYHTFALLTWKNWSVTALFSQHKAIVPTGWFGTDIGNTGTSDLEERNFVEAAWSRPVGQTGTLEWRGYYDQYRYDGLYDYTASYGYRNLDGAFGDWVGNRLVYRRETKRLGNLTVGGEASVDLRNVQYDFDMVDTPSDPLRVDHFRTSHRRTSAGLFVQDEIKISTLWTAYIGARIDASTHDSPFLSPRVALVRARNGGAYKLMYGRAFHNPSTFERYWEPSPGLTAERIDTVEVSREQKLCKRLNPYRLDVPLSPGRPYRRSSGQRRQSPISQYVQSERDGPGNGTERLPARLARDFCELLDSADTGCGLRPPPPEFARTPGSVQGLGPSAAPASRRGRRRAIRRSPYGRVRQFCAGGRAG